MRVLTPAPSDEEVIAAHVALPPTRPTGRAFVRLNMISSSDGGTAISGVSGGLGNRNDHAVFGALRALADGVLVGMVTVVAEHYQPPTGDLRVLVIATEPDISGDPDLFISGRGTLVLTEDAGAAPPGV